MKKICILATSLVLLFACNNEKKEDTKKEDTMMSTDSGKTMQPTEFADPKYAEIGKKMLSQMSHGDIDGWVSNFADNSVFLWSAGDSLAGKAAISAYWKDRRTNVLDSLTYSNDIWLPIKVNIPQKGPDAPGIWLISWAQVTAKYKNGKTVGFWMHVDHHFDANDKIDRTIQYIDRAPINKALGIK